MVAKNAWVQIHKILFSSQERAENLPEDTQKVPFEMWDKGFLLEVANLGDEVTIRTITGRIVSGTLVVVNPAYHHDFGDFVPELLEIDTIVKETLSGGHR
jgi:hypothetical protein